MICKLCYIEIPADFTPLAFRNGTIHLSGE